MRQEDCPHKPKCPAQVSWFVCGQRTRCEEAMRRGLIDRTAGENLMRKYGVSQLTPVSKVYRGEPPADPQGRLL